MFYVADQHFHELRVARGEEDAKCVRADVIDDAQEPELKAQSKCGRKRAVENSCRPWNTAQQYGFSQGTAHWNGEAFRKLIWLRARH